MFGIKDKIKNIKEKAKGKMMEKMMKKQLANLPEDQKNAVMGMVEENPEFFEGIAKEIEVLKSQGKNEMAATMEVMRKKQTEMQQMMMKSMGGDPRMKNRNLQ